MSKCLECEYYDKEKHYCPFFCQLIRETLNEAISFELEQIKAEIEEDKKLYSYNEHIQKGHSNCIDIVNSHISELEGENE